MTRNNKQSSAGCGYRQKISKELAEIVKSGWPLPAENVQCPESDAECTDLERVGREIARLKQQAFHRWELMSYEKGEGATYSSVELGGWDQLTPAQKNLAMRSWIDWRGIGEVQKDNLIHREYFGPPPWERLGVSEMEWQPERNRGRDIGF